MPELYAGNGGVSLIAVDQAEITSGGTGRYCGMASPGQVRLLNSWRRVICEYCGIAAIVASQHPWGTELEFPVDQVWTTL